MVGLDTLAVKLSRVLAGVAFCGKSFQSLMVLLLVLLLTRAVWPINGHSFKGPKEPIALAVVVTAHYRGAGWHNC